jgi:hypothetical protein
VISNSDRGEVDEEDRGMSDNDPAQPDPRDDPQTSSAELDSDALESTDAELGEEDLAPAKKLSPTLAGLILVVLMMIFFGLSQYTEYVGGEQFSWGNDLDAAVAQAKETNRRVFLFLHEADCPHADRYDRELFTIRLVRKRLSEMIPVRKVVSENDPLRMKFGFRRGPMMIMLDGEGEVIGTPLRGGDINELQFRTNIHSDEKR